MLTIITRSRFNKLQQRENKYCLEEQFDMSSIDPSFSYPLVVRSFVLPYYLKAYRITHDEIHTVLVNIDIKDEMKTDELIHELRSSVSALNTTLIESIIISNLILVNTMQTRMLPRNNLKSIIRSHETYINDLMEAVRLQHLNSYNETKQKYSVCWFFCKKLKVEMTARQEYLQFLIAMKIQIVVEVDKLTDKVSTLTQALDYHRKELDFMKAR
ncbi:unnamed protein product [Rotaria socialis]|uniref:Uncharacterized protein n=2 Tax=Rotaria socialis TaxID=392032 RepID=A0A818PM23_9BILA|nr:unnamed protein product [Rotaria socialis]